MEPGWVAGQRAPERGQREDPGLGLGEHPGAGQRAEQAQQRRRVRPDLLAQHPGRHWPGRHEVRDAEHGGGVQRLRELESGQQLDHLHRRRYVVGFGHVVPLLKV